MSARWCDNCGAKSSPHIPRTKVGEQMWCAMCAQNHRPRTAAMQMHPDIAEAMRLFGCHHTHGGRILGAHHLGASRDDQEARLADESGWRHEHTRFQPVRFAIEGARAYNAKTGLGDPHERDYGRIRQDRDTVRTVGRAYDALPEFQQHAVPHFEAMRREVGNQFHHLTHTMGVNVQTVDHDPYANVHELVHDVNANHRLKVLGTHVTGGHPFFSNEDNDKFRAVHDFFGHAATGRDFSRHGEQAAFLAHARMFSPHALPAMTSETKGQNTSLILNGDFGPQKIALLPKEHWAHAWPEHTARLVRLAEQGWTPEDIVRMELGRQKVRTLHTPTGPQQLCERHLEHARQAHDVEQGVAPLLGAGERSGPRVSGEHEGRCVRCAQGQPDDSNPNPWNSPPGGGFRPSPLSEHRPTGHGEGYDAEDPDPMARWPYRPLRSHEELERFRPQMQSLNSRTSKITGPDTAQEVEMGSAVAFTKDGRPAVATVIGNGRKCTIKHVAHDSGDGETIFHCFSGDTRYLTISGVKTFAETVGTYQQVLTAPLGNSTGHWVTAPIREFGRQQIWEVELRRNKQVKIIRTTAGHRWLVRRPDRVVTTENLRKGHRMAHLRATRTTVTPDAHGIRMGALFGDGSLQHREGRTYGLITLWGEKRALGKYFDEVATQAYPAITPEGVEGLRYSSGMAGYTKDLPGLHESHEYLLGWLIGYLAADGNVASTGQVTLSSSVLENLQHVRDVATILGIGAYAPTSTLRKGFDGIESMLHQMGFAAEDFDAAWFIRDDQRRNFERGGGGSRFGWTVAEVRQTEDWETVYCAVVPYTESFALEDNIHTGNCPFCGSGQVIARSDGSCNCEFCSTAFSVQVQPQMPAFPQTINGQPVDVPGMPNGGKDANVPPGSAPVGDPSDPSEPDQQEDGSDNTFPGDADSGGDDSGDDDSKPAFLKGSSLLYRTAAGQALDERQFMRHLALQDPKRRKRVLAQIRAENRARA